LGCPVPFSFKSHIVRFSNRRSKPRILP
jgi:hypothetical protein